MRKMKKLAALCLAMLMAFSIMAVTAAAYDADMYMTKPAPKRQFSPGGRR